MKTITLIFFLSLNLLGQSELLLLMDDNANILPPLTNLELYYAGDVGLSTSSWLDQSGNNRTMTFYNTPTIITGAINGIDAVQFNGTNEYGTVVDGFTLDQPTAVYLLVRVKTNTLGRFLFSGLVGAALAGAEMRGTDVYWRLDAPTSTGVPGTLTLDTYVILRAEFNGASSKLQINDGAVTTGNAGTNNPSGFTLATYGAAYANIEVACVLVYSAIPVDADVKAFFTAKFGLP